MPNFYFCRYKGKIGKLIVAGNTLYFDLAMTKFANNPVLNSPYECPKKHWELGDNGLPTGKIIAKRRRSDYLVPIPVARRENAAQPMLVSSNEHEENRSVENIRAQVDKWRNLPENKWGVSSTTARLLTYWRENYPQPRLFYCQIEAMETLIWLNEVAPKTTEGKAILQEIKEANQEANPQLFRIAAKMATGAGKTTVMAMLIAYHAINKARKPTSKLYAEHFLIVTPGITIKDRLRVLLPQDPNNYYEKKGIVPPDMRDAIKKASVIITNYHAFAHRETRKISTQARAVLQGNNPTPIATKETDGQMLVRICPELLRAKNVVVINDEAHHCYRHKEDGKHKKSPLSEDEKEDAKKDNEAARLWINGIEALGRKIKLQAVIDLSATPFFLRGSGYREGRLFPWVMSDFSLMDAIEAGIVKVPRVPVQDATKEKLPTYRDLYAHISSELPRKNRRDQKGMDPQDLPLELLGAMQALYGNYETLSGKWQEARIKIPPVMIIICNNTSTSKLVYDYVSGYLVNDEWKHGKFALFSNIDKNGKPLARPQTLLVDSYQLESGEGLSDEFKKVAAHEIETFKKDMRTRYPERASAAITDEDLLREVMNTVGKENMLGGQIRCVVSVSMLTEGWDANNVTHILGIRAFGTQLLCEQVVGRGLRRMNYEMDEENNPDHFPPEYAEVFGVPFRFMQGSDEPPKPPKKKTRIRHLEKRASLEITFPRIRGYTIKPSEDRLTANFSDNSHLKITPEDAPPKTINEGIIGSGVMMTLDALKKHRINEVIYNVAAHTAQKFAAKEGGVTPARFRDLLPITRQWINDYVHPLGGTCKQYLLWARLADQAAAIIYRACVPQTDDKELLLPIADPFTPEGSTWHVDFQTSRKRLHQTKKSHINIAVCDSDWEQHFCEILEDDEDVFCYARNDGMAFEVPYEHGKQMRQYRPDFIARVNDGNGVDDLLNLVVEIKGFRRESAKAKADTMDHWWVPAVNNDGRWGRWAFVEIINMQDARTKLAEFTQDGKV